MALPAFGTLHLPGVVFSYAENGGKLLLAFRATIVIAGHLVSLLFFELFPNYNF